MFKLFERTLSRLTSFKPLNLCGRRNIRREPLQPVKKCPRWVCVDDAVKCITTENLIFVQGGAGTPMELIKAMTEYAVCNNLRDIKLVHMALEGDVPFAQADYERNFRSTSLYIGANLREAVNEGRADYIPVFNHETPNLFYHKKFKPDIALIHVSAPDIKGFCSLGTSVDCARAAICTAKVIVAQVNEHMPRTFGDAVIHSSHIDWAVKCDQPLPCIASACPPNELEKDIGKKIAEELVEDGSTIQLGIGNLPDAIMEELRSHKDLGVHSECFGDGMVDLIEKGAINCKKKTKDKGRIVSSMALGTKKVYDFLHNNPFISMLGLNYVNDPTVIAKQHKMVAVQPCIEMDITGQICADSLGTKMYNGAGGQLDFLQGAAMARDGKGKSIVALPSVTSKGESRIQPVLKLGGGVVTTRAHTHYVATEHGIVDLYGKTLRQRAYALIQVAHPEHRECLERAAYDRLKAMPTKYL